MKDYYEILEVNKKASQEVIEKAYKVLAKKYHPDLYSSIDKKNAENKLKDINEAYRVLSSSFLKEQYDKELEKENKKRQEVNKQNIVNKNIKTNTVNTKRQEIPMHKVGSFMGLVDVIKAVIPKRNMKLGEKKLKEEDIKAAWITLIIVIVLGIILWFIPATNQFIRSLNPF